VARTYKVTHYQLSNHILICRKFELDFMVKCITGFRYYACSQSKVAKCVKVYLLSPSVFWICSKSEIYIIIIKVSLWGTSEIVTTLCAASDFQFSQILSLIQWPVHISVNSSASWLNFSQNCSEVQLYICDQILANTVMVLVLQSPSKGSNTSLVDKERMRPG